MIFSPQLTWRGVSLAATATTIPSRAIVAIDTTSGGSGERTTLPPKKTRDVWWWLRVQDVVLRHAALARHFDAPMQVVELADRMRLNRK